MIFLVQFGINKLLLIFSKTTNCARPTGSFNFVSLWKDLLVLIYSKLHLKLCDYLKVYEVFSACMTALLTKLFTLPGDVSQLLKQPLKHFCISWTVWSKTKKKGGMRYTCMEVYAKELSACYGSSWGHHFEAQNCMPPTQVMQPLSVLGIKKISTISHRVASKVLTSWVVVW